jgi:hypothetical protein
MLMLLNIINMKSVFAAADDAKDVHKMYIQVITTLLLYQPLLLDVIH